MRRLTPAVMPLIAATFALLPAGHVAAQLPAFPGAQGFGALATGGRGGEVFHVTSVANTNTGTYEGPNGYNRGTLRWCLLSETSNLPRTIVFDVGGQAPLTSQITIENSNLTVAGQTAPGQGLSTQGRPWLFESGNNLVIRHVRNRLGRNGGQDSMGVEGGSNIIFDHVTSTWSNDEALSVAKDGTLVTVQNSLIYEGLNHSGHGYGSLIRPDVDSKVTYHHNLYANNESRNPRPGTYNSRTLDFDFRNNVIYNWGDRAGYSGGSSEGNPEHVNMNYVGNYAIAGASTHNNATFAFVTDTNADLRAHQSGNLIDSDLDALRDGADTGWAMFRDDPGNPGVLTQMATPFAFTGVPVTTSSAAQAYDDVLDYAGSFWWNRDAADARVVNQVRTQTGTIIDHENDVGGFPTLPMATREASWDADHDGMPDAWETRHGLNPSASADRNSDFDSDGYTNLEEYLNEAGAWPAPSVIGWAGGTGRYALNANWDVWQPSRFDEVHVNAGTATVDAVGQHAGLLRIAPQAGATARVNVTAGRLEAAEEIVIGTNLSKGTLALSGGELHAPLLSKGTGGGLEFVGGDLHADQVNFDLENNGGTLAPGHSVGTTVVQGDLTLNSGVLEIEIGGTSFDEYDRVEVHGVAHLGGTLRVELVDLGGGTFAPQLGDSFAFLAGFGGTSGMFAALDLPPLAPGLAWAIGPGDVATFLTIVPQPLAGNQADFNHDGEVDASDLAVWQAGFGLTGQTSNDAGDADADGDVDGGDFLMWQRQLGAAKPDAASVPEPATSVAAVVGAAILAFDRRHFPRLSRSRMRQQNWTREGESPPHERATLMTNSAGMIRALTLLAAVAVAPRAPAAERYVATTGSNAGGNLGTDINMPLATISQAITLAQPGDTIFVRGGTYALASRIQINNKSGTQANPFQLFAYPGESPVLDFRTQALGQRGIELNSDYWHLKGFTVQYAGDNGVFISGSNNTLELLTTRQNNDSGVQISASGGRTPANNLVLNVDSYANYDFQNDNRGENADGFAVKFRGLGPGNILRGVRAWNNSDDGFDFWQAENGVTVENSWAFHNGRSSLFSGVPGTYAGDGNGVKLGHDSGTHLIQDMLVWGHPANGIDVNGNATDLEDDPPTIPHGVTILNNTAFNNSGRNFRFDEDPTTASPPTAHVLRNNISYQGPGVQIDTGNTHDHNSWNPGLAPVAADFLSIIDPLTANGSYAPITDRAGTTTPMHATGPALAPRLADGSLPLLDFLQLAPTSKFLNAGVDVGLPFAGAAPDLGAFEYTPPVIYAAADFNEDGAVDAADLGAWSAGFGTASDADHADGDADADGDVDGADFLVWQQQLSATPGVVAAAGVPEPATTALALAAIGILGRYGIRPRRPR